MRSDIRESRYIVYLDLRVYLTFILLLLYPYRWAWYNLGVTMGGA